MKDNEIMYRGHKIAINQVEDTDLGYIKATSVTDFILFNKYTHLGIEHEYDVSEEAKDDRFEFVKLGTQEIKKQSKALICKPVYCYEHGSTAFSFNSSGQFSCRFDSGVAGFAIVTREALKRKLLWKRITAERLKELESKMYEDLRVLDAYLRDEFYYTEITGPTRAGVRISHIFYDWKEAEEAAKKSIDDSLPVDASLNPNYDYYIYYEGDPKTQGEYRKGIAFEVLDRKFGWSRAEHAYPFLSNTLYRRRKGYEE
jgi:hypothetical protein